MTRLVAGVIGHVNHGKTALVGALTGIETDRLPEERARGMSIALGFAHCAVAGGEIDLIDMPGHERFVRTMVSGATGMEAVLLVVDAREGVMPQTSEHLDIAALLGVDKVVLAVSRVDLAHEAAVAASQRGALAAAARAGLLVLATARCSARTGQGLDDLRGALSLLLGAAPARADDGFCYLPVDRAFSIAGHGTVVTGTLRRGAVAAGDTVEIMPAGLLARVRGLQVHGQRVPAAQPGQRVAVNLRGVEVAQLPRGVALATPGALGQSSWMSVRLRAVPGAPALRTTQTVRLLAGTAEVQARLRLLDRDSLAAGETALAQLQCSDPFAAPAREKFILRAGSPSATVAGGVLLEPQGRRQRRHSGPVLARLGDLACCVEAGDLGKIVAGELARAGLAGLALDGLGRLAGISAARAASLLGPGDRVSHGVAMSAEALRQAMAQAMRVLGRESDGLAQGQLATLMPQVGAAVLEEAVRRLVAAGRVSRVGAALRVPRPELDRVAAQRAQKMAGEIAERVRAAGLTPPDEGEIAPDPGSRGLLDRLVREGVLVRAPDRVQKRAVLFHREAVEGARRRLAPLLADGQGLLVKDIGAILGISRKFSVPLLEHLDSVRFTRRVAERRVLAAPP